MKRSGASFAITNGCLRGRLTDNEGADALPATARETAIVGKRWGVARLDLHRAGPGEGGRPVVAEDHTLAA